MQLGVRMCVCVGVVCVCVGGRTTFSLLAVTVLMQTRQMLQQQRGHWPIKHSTLAVPCCAMPCRAFQCCDVPCRALLCRAVLQVLATQQSLLTHGGCLLRSKGFVWLASCPDRVVEWSSSGLLLEVCLAHPWFATLPEVG